MSRFLNGMMRPIWQLLFGLMILSSISACQAGPVASSTLAERKAVVPSPTAIIKPAVVYTVAAPTDLPAFDLVNPDELAATEEARPTQAPPTATVLPSATITASPVPSITPSPTPQPTFTPPALPMTSPAEHYWLRRPIPDGQAVWTDKAYPYGSTKGGTLRPHHGVEFPVPRSTEILAAASGTVVVAGDDSTTAYGPQNNFYGNLVVIELDSRLNGQAVYNLYAHLSEVYVAVGQHVNAWDVIALSGSSGVADGPHLHFEVRVGQNSYNSTRNPLLWLYPFPNRGSVAGRVIWPSGELVGEAPIRLRRIDAPSQYAATTSYGGDGVNADSFWEENFALDDVVAGYYEVIVTAGAEKYAAEVWVYPYQTSFVEITIGAGG